MKLKYDAEYRCRACGVFTMSNQSNIHDSVDCPKCHRSGEFVRGKVWRIPDGESRKKHKSQKAIVDESSE
jgi:Zn finger protein HypA/HybF involved in hydrogenase expression